MGTSITVCMKLAKVRSALQPFAQQHLIELLLSAVSRVIKAEADRSVRTIQHQQGSPVSWLKATRTARTLSSISLRASHPNGYRIFDSGEPSPNAGLGTAGKLWGQELQGKDRLELWAGALQEDD